jgi:hypothetical protein
MCVYICNLNNLLEEKEKKKKCFEQYQKVKKKKKRKSIYKDKRGRERKTSGVNDKERSTVWMSSSKSNNEAK